MTGQKAEAMEKIQDEELAGNGAWMICEFEKLEELTLRGWILVRLVETTDLKQINKEVVHYRGDDPSSRLYGDGSDRWATRTVVKSVPIRVTCCLLRFDEAPSLAVSSREITALKKTLADAETKVNEFRKSLAAEMADSERCRIRSESLSKDLGMTLGELRQMKIDIDKARAAIGDIRWRELVGEPAS